MEDLTKQQMVLLTLLVSFVASIATSISVVSLLNETPTTITQTVNRIVEKTIEKVVPAAILPAPLPPSPKEILVVNEGDRIAGAVEMNLPKIVSIWSGKTEKEEGTERGIGFAVSADGIILTDKNILGESADYSAVFPNGTTYKAKKVYTDENSNIAVLRLRDEKDQNATSSISFVSFASNEPKLGSLVIALGGKEGAAVYQGIVSEKIKNQIITSISFRQMDRGGIIFGADGKVLGMNVIGADEGKYAVPSASILATLENYRKAEAAKTP
jgi:S1-C subfamily serine protease